ncbi:TMV resistance protein N-like [Gossypium australe]|uniref:TMV resistance protein N-like n=1 Tax=Gossypium australe TaxID=47621 RepID=A0A5B6VIQ7_9ROSI|nr:TMV resistance protein N-like [Gossypium australe]
MKETRTIKQYADMIISIVNNIKLLVITTLPDKYESKISSLEDLRDLTTISLSKLINALYAQEQKRVSREKGHTECAYQARNKESPSSSRNKCKGKWNQTKERPKRDDEKKSIHHALKKRPGV